MKEKISSKDIFQTINELVGEINQILNEFQKEKYFYGIILIYSFIENILKYFVALEVIWRKSEKRWNKEEKKLMKKFLENFCKRLSFVNAVNLAFSLDIINFNLYEKIERIRKERNNIIHQFWVYQHKKDYNQLRKKIRKSC